MNLEIKHKFLDRWERYFPEAELPLTFYYTDETGRAPAAEPGAMQHCLIGNLLQVRNGQPLCFDKDNVLCGGGKRYAGFTTDLRANFEYFLSCGIPGELEGERYKKSPQLVTQQMQFQPPFESPGRYIVFKRWDRLDEQDEPLVVLFFAHADILAGLFTLANYDARTPYGVISPMGSGCSAIIYYPYHELRSDNPRCVLGMFDVSARPYVQSDVLTFAVPWKKFIGMLENMDESFLITDTWGKVRSRIRRGGDAGMVH